MSERRFSVRLRSECDGVVYSFFDGDKPLDVDMIVDKLNDQESIIKELKERNAHNFAKKMQLMKEIKELKAKLREKEEDEQLYANEIVKLNKEAKEVLDFKSLGGNY